jgi:fatty acid desaturase
MAKLPVMNPFMEWRHTDIKWIRVNISKEDQKRFIKRSNLKGLIQTFSFLFIIAVTAFISYYAFTVRNWILLAVGLYLHGMLYRHFPSGIHELAHNTVFESKFLNKAVTFLFGLLYWPQNPYFYRASHLPFHHKYTLHQYSDGEDTPNYVEFDLKTILILLFKVLNIKTFVHCISRLFTLKPTSAAWRPGGCQLDLWEKFVLERAPEKQQKDIHRFAVISLFFHILFVVVCILTGYWFLIILITLAPFYGSGLHFYMVVAHQHACCEANNPDFRKSCRDVIHDPISSILYWHMECHIEHHMFAGIPCYNLKKFSKFVANQLPEKEYAIPLMIKLACKSREMFGSKEEWRENFGRFKGV